MLSTGATAVRGGGEGADGQVGPDGPPGGGSGQAAKGQAGRATAEPQLGHGQISHSQSAPAADHSAGRLSGGLAVGSQSASVAAIRGDCGLLQPAGCSAGESEGRMCFFWSLNNRK